MSTEVLFLVLTGSFLLATLVYGVFTPWYISWTGRGLFFMLMAMSAITVVYAIGILFHSEAVAWLRMLLYIVLISAVNVGITGNIAMQQFVNPMLRKKKERRKSNGNK